MQSIDIYIRFSDQNVKLDKVTTLNREGNLIYNDEGENFKAHLVTIGKFTLLTVASPLIVLARLVRSVVFVCRGSFSKAGKEFVGAFATPLMTSVCLAGAILGTSVYAISFKQVSFYAYIRRTYAYFEAWMNGTRFQDPRLVSYSQRVTTPFNCIEATWTTAPCMQPVLEGGDSSRAGLLDVERMKKIFPLITVLGVKNEDGKIVIQSAYEYKDVHYVSCCNMCEQARAEMSYCCYRIDAAYNRVLCCEIGQANCTNMADHNDSCGINFCTACGIGICCCTTKTETLTTVNIGCIA